MDTLYRCCAGLDVHKKTVVACVRSLDQAGRVHHEVRTFGTMTADLLALADWLGGRGVTHAAMESTGVYWKPVFNLLEGHVEVILVNAQHVKQVPGRKTDVTDCQWLADLLAHGLRRASFVPPAPIRELRDLTRQRAQLVAERATAANRIQKVLEDCNIKLAAVATDALGASGRDIIEALIAGEEDPEQLADRARGRLRQKIPALQAALRGRVTEHHRFQLRLLLDHWAHLEALIGRLGARIEDVMAPFAQAAERLTTIPGVEQRTAEVVLAEIGTDMEQFPTAAHLASWAGLCPGNNESAGKRRSGRTTKGSRWLRQALTQAAWAASHTKDTYLAAQFRRLAARRGKKRALVAVGHTLLVIIYHLLKGGGTYQELGGDFLERLEPERLTRQLVRRLEKLGHQVTLKPKEDAA
ncbi:MAG TPA: IS110 family transposase [Gemmataceae bacterium]|nr:IS110 family transposase [Gemmataceae bacterium]